MPASAEESRIILQIQKKFLPFLKLWYRFTSVPYCQMLFPLKLAKSPHISHLNGLSWDAIMTIACYRKKKPTQKKYIEYVVIVCDYLLIFL